MLCGIVFYSHSTPSTRKRTTLLVGCIGRTYTKQIDYLNKNTETKNLATVNLTTPRLMLSIKPEFSKWWRWLSIKLAYATMVTYAEHLAWCGGGYVHSFGFKSGINRGAALSHILFLVIFFIRFLILSWDDMMILAVSYII